MKALTGFMAMVTTLCCMNVSAFVNEETVRFSAADTQNSSGETSPQYYSFEESSSQLLDSTEAGNENSFSSPQAMITYALSTSKRAVSLLSWMIHDEAMPEPAESYRRVAQFGRWINDPTDDNCMNTRARVLVRDSEAAVTFRNNRNCVVDTGYWVDPYAGEELKSSRQIQIDHMVPLKHAYVSGAWKWDYKTRCLYANFLGAKYHLLSVSGHENMSKGDRAPDGYIPPSENFRCEYLQAWLKIKAIWKLSINKAEANAIQELVRESDCNTSDFVISNKEMSEMRTYINDNINYCEVNQR